MVFMSCAAVEEAHQPAGKYEWYTYFESILPNFIGDKILIWQKTIERRKLHLFYWFMFRQQATVDGSGNTTEESKGRRWRPL